MHTHNTVEKMNQMKLLSMASMYQKSISDNHYSEFTTDELIALLVDTEWEYRENRKIELLTKSAGFKSTTVNIDYSSNRNLDKNMFERLLSLQFIKKAENIVITGPSGVGKSYLAQAIGNIACRNLTKVLYYNTTKLQEEVKLGKLQGTYLNLIKKMKKADLLILDDFGLNALDATDRQAFFEIIEDRYDCSSTIITSQIPVKGWHEIIGEGTIADAILDRIAYSSHRIELYGESLRKNRKITL